MNIHENFRRENENTIAFQASTLNTFAGGRRLKYDGMKAACRLHYHRMEVAAACIRW
jgi:hypothetical protein